MKYETTNKGYLKTEKKIYDSFFEILLSKGVVNFVTVKDICDKAGIRRSTFYLHFSDVNDVVEQISTTFYNSLERTIPERISSSADIVGFCKGYVNLCKKNEKYLKPIMHNKENVLIFDRALSKARKDLVAAFDRGGRASQAAKDRFFLITNGLFASLDRFIIGKVKTTYEDIENTYCDLCTEVFK